MNASVTEGNITVDGSGTVEEIKAELAAETPRADPRKGRLTDPVVVVGAQADGDAGADVDADDDGAADDTRTTDQDASVAGKALGKKKKSLQKRIDALSAESHTTARERDQARAEVARLTAELEGRTAKTDDKAAPKGKLVAGVPIDAEKFPKYAKWLETAPDDANDLEDWVQAERKWDRAKEQATADAEKARETHSETFTTQIRTFHERLAPTLKEDPKFYEKIDPRLLDTPAASALPPGTKPTFGNFLVQQVITSENPKDLMVWLSRPDVIRRLVTLQPDAIIREIAKQELSTRPAGAEDTGPLAEEHGDPDDDGDGDEVPARRASVPAAATSQASPPVKPVRGSSQQSADQEPGDDASDDAWYRWETRKNKPKAH